MMIRRTTWTTTTIVVVAVLRLLVVVSLHLPDIVQADGVILTKSNWEEYVQGKKVFIKFFAPWCQHCQKMKKTWDRLMEDYNTDYYSDHVLIADVDCTSTDGRPLCTHFDVEGYPTLKYGDPSNMELYDGQRDYDALSSHVLDQLAPSCSPEFLNLCNRGQKQLIRDYMAMDETDLDELIEVAMEEYFDIEHRYDTQLQELEDYAQVLQERRDDVVDVEKQIVKLARDVQIFRRMQERIATVDDSGKD